MVRIKSTVGGGLRRVGAVIVLLFIMTPELFARLSSRTVDVVAAVSAMLVVVFKRLRHNLGLSVSSVLGVIAVLGIVVCVPVFSHSVSSKVLKEQLSAKALSTRRSLFSMHMYYLDKRSATQLTVEKVQAITDFLNERIPSALDLKVNDITSEVQTGAIGWDPVQVQANLKADEAWINMGIAASDMVPKNGEIVEGAWPQVTDSGPVQVAVMEDLADKYFMNVGDIYQLMPSRCR